jgi:predicted acetyltransferase
MDNGEDVESRDGFAAYVESLRAPDTTPLKEGHVTCTYRWIVEGDEYLGSVSFRHELNDFLLNYGGHIGYGVRPAARRRGIATWALGETLVLARERGYDRVLLTCRDDNAASAATIEKHGGVLEDKRTHDGTPMRRYWISL